MKKLTIILLFFISISLYAEPDWGQYKMIGKAYVNDSIPIVNDTLFFLIANKKIMVLTDKAGNYSLTIIWSTWDLDAGMPTGVTIDKKNEELNPALIVKYNNLTATTKNYWKEELIKAQIDRGKTQNVDLKFKK